jgi:hypothetical protein
MWTEIYWPGNGGYRCVMRLFTKGMCSTLKCSKQQVLVLNTMFCCNNLWRLDALRNGAFTDVHRRMNRSLSLTKRPSKLLLLCLSLKVTKTAYSIGTVRRHTSIQICLDSYGRVSTASIVPQTSVTLAVTR